MEKFDIAFSYASEQNQIVETFKTVLENMGLSVFVDTDHPELFVFQHVPDVLKEIYDDNDTAMLIFLSEDYIRKDFTKYEGHIAFDRLLKEKRLSIVKLDDAVLPWLPSSLHFFDMRKNSVNFICQALYTAIRGECIPDINNCFQSLKDYLIINCRNIKVTMDSETCMIFCTTPKERINIKLTCNTEQQEILIYYNAPHIEESIFSIAEIERTENKFIFYNKGISDSDQLISEFVSETELNHKILAQINILLRN